MKDITVAPNITIRQAMKKLTQIGEKCLIVTDEKNKLLGTLSDGDLRKAILDGRMMGDNIDQVFQRRPTALCFEQYTLSEVKRLFAKEKFDIIPLVDDENQLKDVLYWKNIFDDQDSGEERRLSTPVVIMAGGKGTRMEPFTKVLPKSLVPVHERPVIEHIIQRFRDVGCSDFYLTINYKGRILRAYFEELQPDFGVHFVEEKEPLGTAGSLRLLEGKFTEPFFVTNCDILISADYPSIYEFHLDGGYDISLVASAKEYVIPYGTCEISAHGDLSHINEKPSYELLINTGLYVLNPDVLELIPKNQFFHITHLIEAAKHQGKKVGVFPIDDETWVDVGQWAEYQKAVNQM